MYCSWIDLLPAVLRQMPRGRAAAKVEIDFKKRKEKRKEQGWARELPRFDPRSPVEKLAKTEQEDKGIDAGECADQPCGDEHPGRRTVVQRQRMASLGAAAYVYVCIICSIRMHVHHVICSMCIHV